MLKPFLTRYYCMSGAGRGVGVRTGRLCGVCSEFNCRSNRQAIDGHDFCQVLRAGNFGGRHNTKGGGFFANVALRRETPRKIAFRRGAIALRNRGASFGLI